MNEMHRIIARSHDEWVICGSGEKALQGCACEMAASMTAAGTGRVRRIFMLRKKSRSDNVSDGVRLIDSLLANVPFLFFFFAVTAAPLGDGSKQQ